MRVLGPVVLAQALLVAGRKPDLRLGGAIGAQLVRRDHVWRVTLLLQEFAHERDGCGLVAPPLHEQVQHLALVVDGTGNPSTGLTNPAMITPAQPFSI